MTIYELIEFQLNIQKLKTTQLQSLHYSFSFMSKLFNDEIFRGKSSLVALNNVEGSPNIAYNAQFIAF